MSLVCGIDAGSLKTPSYVAWLRDQEFLLDIYIPSSDKPLPESPESWSQPLYVAIDAPQGLPAPGKSNREADREASTPTKRLPADRVKLAQSKLYKGLIEAGIEIFWSVHEGEWGRIPGLDERPEWPVVFETYPRYVIRQLWPRLDIPSKRRAPLMYVNDVWGKLQGEGYHCSGVTRPTVDQVDAMVCALAAEACLETGGWRGMTVGGPPVVDEDARVLREGYIVSPKRRE